MRSLRASSPVKVATAVVAAACTERLLFPETDGVPGIAIMLSLNSTCCGKPVARPPQAETRASPRQYVFAPGSARFRQKRAT